MNPGHKRNSCVLAVAGLMLSTAQGARADVVLEWNAIAMRTLTTQKPMVNPFAQARFAANDSLIASFWTKSYYFFGRPHTATTRGSIDDSDWKTAADPEF